MAYEHIIRLKHDLFLKQYIIETICLDHLVFSDRLNRK